MEYKAERSGENWLPTLLTALLLGVGLHELFGLWPSVVTEFLSPVNNSIWEHVKVVFWPLLLVEWGCFPPEHRSGGLFALLAACAGMLAAGWMYHLWFRGSALWVDLLIFGMSILSYFLLSDSKQVQKTPLPLVRLGTLLLGALIVLFTLSPPHGALFSDPQLAVAWSSSLC